MCIYRTCKRWCTLESVLYLFLPQYVHYIRETFSHFQESPHGQLSASDCIGGIQIAADPIQMESTWCGPSTIEIINSLFIHLKHIIMFDQKLNIFFL